MKVYNAEDLRKHTFDQKILDQYILPWGFRKENPAHQIRIQSLKNLTMESIHDRYRWSEEKTAAWRLEQIQQLVDWAFSTSKFYRQLYKTAGFEPGAIRSLSDFQQLPIVRRADLVREFPDGIVSDQFEKEKCRWLFSSGSSGTPVQLIMPQERTEWDSLHRLRMFEIMASASFPKDRWLYNVNHAHWWHTSFNGDHPVFSISQRAPIEETILHIKRLRPIFLSCITSFALKLGEAGVRLADFGVLAVSTNSETSSPQTRARLAGIFGVPVCDEYSSEEAGLLASECPHHTFHCVEDDTYLETIHTEPNGIGEILATDLWNFAMPVIRYDQGDLGSLSALAQPCACGSHFREIKHLQGRKDESFRGNGGRLVMAGEMLELSELYLSPSGMYEYRVTQKEKDFLLVQFSRRAADSIDQKLLTEFRERMAVLFGHPLRIDFEENPALFEEKKHKRKVFVSEVKK